MTNLRAELAAAGYTAEALKQRLGAGMPDDVGALNRAPALERLARDRSPAGTLLRLFFLEAPEPVRRVAAALSRRRCDELMSAGVLRRRGDAVCAQIRIDPVGGQYFMADTRFRPFARSALHLTGNDPVYPPSSDSLILRDAIAAGTPRTVLDLCTGSGVQGLQQAADGRRIVAVDINRRAAAMARLNAQLNGAAIDVRTGDLYGPVAGEQFDLIIANPPFVVSPYARGPSYHSGGPTGDRVLRRIIGGLAAHLRPRGRAFAISHLALRRGEDIEAVARRWFRNFPGRALVLVLETGTPVDLAAAQSLFALQQGLRAYAGEVSRWVDYLRRQRIDRVALLLIAAERAGRRRVEVVDAQPRVLPIPLTPSPPDRITRWLGATGDGRA